MMNIDEARALCDGSKRVSFCSEPGFVQLVCFDGVWMDSIDIDYVPLKEDPEGALLRRAAKMVLADNIENQVKL